MKTFKKIKLVNLCKDELKEREMNKISAGEAGECCICSHGSENHIANSDSGLYRQSLMGTFDTFRW